MYSHDDNEYNGYNIKDKKIDPVHASFIKNSISLWLCELYPVGACRLILPSMSVRTFMSLIPPATPGLPTAWLEHVA